MPNLRVLIADDDPGMRLILHQIIQREPGFDLVAEASNGLEAIRLAEEHRPDIAFLDIEMPGDIPGSFCSGIESARTICSLNDRTAIIFVTAHEEFMPEAFSLYAFDYLVKPFRIERVRQTLAKLAGFIGVKHDESMSPGIAGRLTLRTKDGVLFLDTDSIIFAEHENRCTRIVTSEGAFQSPDSLNDLEQKLPSPRFIRTHRSYIVNTRYITKATPYGRWTYTLHFKGTAESALITAEKLAALQG